MPCQWECENGSCYGRVPQKIKHRITVWSSNSTSGHQPRVIESKILKRYTYFYFYFFNWRTIALLCCISAVQQHELAVSMHTSPLSSFSLTPRAHPRTLSWTPCVVQKLPTKYLFHTCCVLSRVWLFATPWTGARQAPLSLEFLRQEYWSGLPFPPLGDLLGQGSNPRLLH